MLKTSLLRQSAQKYATGSINKGDYLLYRKKLLDAIDNGEKLPELPEEWQSLKGSAMNPELQTLMTQMHEMDETAKETSKLSRTTIIIAVAVIAFLLLAVTSFVVFKRDSAPEKKNYIEQLNHQVDNIFIANSSKIIHKNKWINSEILLITRQWSNLTKIQKTSYKRHLVVQQLKSRAIEELKLERDSELKNSIQKLLDVIQ